MSAAHTPGPWRYTTEPQPNGCPIIGAQGLMVAMLAHSINQSEQREVALANARLIAAAPDLLNALTVLADAAEAFGIPVEAARASITRATGAA